MIDIQLLRTDIDAVARRLATRGYTLDVGAFKALEEKRRQIQTATEQLQSQRNVLAKQVGEAKAKKDEARAAAEALRDKEPDYPGLQKLLESLKP